MELEITRQETTFRNEIQRFISEHLPAATQKKMELGLPLSREEMVDWQRILNKKKWATPGWPAEFGGPGWTPVQRYLFYDELHLAAAPEPLSFNVTMVGPVIIEFGTAEQKNRFLPRIANLDDWWCQGFSEPGAGSDLASLTTHARRDGDCYIVNGQKTWTTQAQHADWMFALVRTDASAKKQKGISFLLIDMKSPGVSIRPIISIDGRHEINEVFLDNVQVPVSNLVGEENRGWDCAKFLLGHERTGQARVGIAKERIRTIKKLAGQSPEGRPGMMDDPRFVDRLTQLEIDTKALEITLLRALAASETGQSTQNTVLTSMLKIKGSELRQSASELLLQLAGPHAMRAVDGEKTLTNDELDDLNLWPAAAASTYFFWRALSIYGGTTEIQKNVIAKLTLGLS